MDIDDFASNLIGKTYEEAKHLIKCSNYRYRVTRKDSAYYAITMDFDAGRLDLELDNGIVTQVGIG